MWESWCDYKIVLDTQAKYQNSFIYNFLQISNLFLSKSA